MELVHNWTPQNHRSLAANFLVRIGIDPYGVSKCSVFRDPMNRTYCVLVTETFKPVYLWKEDLQESNAPAAMALVTVDQGGVGHFLSPRQPQMWGPGIDTFPNLTRQFVLTEEMFESIYAEALADPPYGSSS